MKVHPGATISEKAMTLMNSLILHAFEKIAEEASKIAKCSKKSGGFLEIAQIVDILENNSDSLRPPTNQKQFENHSKP